MWLIKQILEAPMTPLQEHLYQYIMEDRFTALLADEAYQAVRQQVSDAEAQLLAAPPEEQICLSNTLIRKTTPSVCSSGMCSRKPC